MTNDDSRKTTARQKREELFELVKDMDIALMTTRRADGSLVSRPMATQRQTSKGDLWFVTNIETDKVDELEFDSNVNLGYYDDSSKEWVSVSGIASISQDREKIRDLYEPDWKAYFGDEGRARDGSADDPRIALIFVEVHSVVYMKSHFSKPRALFEIAKGMVTGDTVDLGRTEHVSEVELGG